jgi:hypothetical protein
LKETSDTDWTGQPAYRIQLRDYQQLDPPLDRAWLFKDDTVADEVKAIAREPRGRGIFFNEKLELNQGAYLTEASPRLVSLLNNVYLRHTGQGLAGIAAGIADRPVDILCGIYGTRFVEYLTIRSFDEFDRGADVFVAHLRDAMQQLWTRPPM